MVLIQMLLPTRDSTRATVGVANLRDTRAEIVNRFGGVTAYIRSPAAGAWTSPAGDVEEDDVVMIEILADTFDRQWWRGYVEVLKQRFAQESIHVRATAVETLDDGCPSPQRQ
jgi:hypothetical protein